MAKEGDGSGSEEGRLKDEPEYNEEQYELLRRCSEKKDMTEWNEWRKENPDKDICLQGGNFKSWWLEGANFMHGTCNNTDYSGEVHLEGCVFEGARLKNAEFFGTRLERSRFYVKSGRSSHRFFQPTTMDGTWSREAKMLALSRHCRSLVGGLVQAGAYVWARIFIGCRTVQLLMCSICILQALHSVRT